MDYNLDPTTWYSNREMDFTPVHFTTTRTMLTIESKLWIINNLRGRFSVVPYIDPEKISTPWVLFNNDMGVPAFEDPKEAVLYELMWT